MLSGGLGGYLEGQGTLNKEVQGAFPKLGVPFRGRIIGS